MSVIGRQKAIAASIKEIERFLIVAEKSPVTNLNTIFLLKEKLNSIIDEHNKVKKVLETLQGDLPSDPVSTLPNVNSLDLPHKFQLIMDIPNSGVFCNFCSRRRTHPIHKLPVDNSEAIVTPHPYIAPSVPNFPLPGTPFHCIFCGQHKEAAVHNPEKPTADTKMNCRAIPHPFLTYPGGHPYLCADCGLRKEAMIHQPHREPKWVDITEKCEFIDQIPESRFETEHHYTRVYHKHNCIAHVVIPDSHRVSPKETIMRLDSVHLLLSIKNPNYRITTSGACWKIEKKVTLE